MLQTFYHLQGWLLSFLHEHPELDICKILRNLEDSPGLITYLDLHHTLVQLGFNLADFCQLSTLISVLDPQTKKPGYIDYRLLMRDLR